MGPTSVPMTLTAEFLEPRKTPNSLSKNLTAPWGFGKWRINFQEHFFGLPWVFWVCQQKLVMRRCGLTLAKVSMWIDSCHSLQKAFWLRLTSTRFGGLYYDEHALGYLGEWNCVCLCLWISLCIYTTFLRLKHVKFLNQLELLFCSIWSFPCCYSWVQICQCLVFPSPRWVRSQWHNHLGSTKKRKRKHGTRNNTKEKGRDKLVEEEMTSINLMMLGPELSTYPPLVCHFMFSVCVPGNGEDKKTLFVSLPFFPIL